MFGSARINHRASEMPLAQPILPTWTAASFAKTAEYDQYAEMGFETSEFELKTVGYEKVQAYRMLISNC